LSAPNHDKTRTQSLCSRSTSYNCCSASYLSFSSDPVELEGFARIFVYFLPKIRLRAGFPSSKLAGAITSLLTLLFILYYYISPTPGTSITSDSTAQVTPPPVVVKQEEMSLPAAISSVKVVEAVGKHTGTVIFLHVSRSLSRLPLASYR
jgi:hypothetical protein